MAKTLKYLSVAIFSVTLPLNCFAGDSVMQFHVVKNSDTERHISNIPAKGYKPDGSIKDSYNPNALLYQHEQMLAELNKQQQALMLKAQLEAEQEQLAQEMLPEESVPAMPGNRGTQDELTELEKRTSRVEPQ